MSLTFDKLANRNGDIGNLGHAIIEVPEFNGPGADEDETVNVFSMTVGDIALMEQYTTQVKGMEHARLTVIAALAARDDEGDLVFGKTKGEAIRNVEMLPQRYEAAVARIATAAMRLTRGHAIDRRGQRIDDDDEGEEENSLDEAQAVKRAEKN